MNSCKNAVNDTVLDADEFDRNIFRNLVSPTGIERNYPITNLKLALGLYLLFDNSCRIWSSKDRSIIPVGKFRNRTYMIKVPVSAYNCPYSPIDLFHDSIIRNRPHLDQFERMHFVNFNIFVNLNSVKPKPHVQNNNIFTYDYCSHIAAHLVIAANCNNSYFSHIF